MGRGQAREELLHRLDLTVPLLRSRVREHVGAIVLHGNVLNTLVNGHALDNGNGLCLLENLACGIRCYS